MRRTRPSRRTANPVLSLVLVNAAGGAVVALLLVGSILGLDIGGIGTLVRESDVPAVPVAMLVAGFVITFSSVAMGSAIMRVGRDETDRPGGFGSPIPVPVVARRTIQDR
jgi:hypothetical protein